MKGVSEGLEKLKDTSTLIVWVGILIITDVLFMPTCCVALMDIGPLGGFWDGGKKTATLGTKAIIAQTIATKLNHLITFKLLTLLSHFD
jgi:hypothetical protein